MNSSKHSATVKNLSLGGALVDIDINLELGDEVSVAFGIPTLEQEVECEGTIRWVSEDGIGIQFGTLKAIHVWGLTELFKKMSNE